MKRPFLVSVLATAMTLTTGIALAAGQVSAEEKTQTQKPNKIYGSQLMTPQERGEFRAKMRAAKTPEEREQIRKEHHQRMQERAKERGASLPEEPQARGSGMRSGGGMGLSGMRMGAGGGMGPGGSAP